MRDRKLGGLDAADDPTKPHTGPRLRSGTTVE
jgi:hypothetical protein